jgi:hypothetical protein
VSLLASTDVTTSIRWTPRSSSIVPISVGVGVEGVGVGRVSMWKSKRTELESTG